jgi:sugar phosphate isomerase/epimerase
MPSRRSFLGATSSAAAAALLPRGAAAGAFRPREGADRIERVGLQLYTVRSEMRKDVGATLQRVAEIGYSEVEFAGFFELAPSRVRELLDANGLVAPAAHYAMDAIEVGLDAAAAAAKTIGIRRLIVASLPMRQLQTAADWKDVAARFNAAGKRAGDAGLRVGFHNHEAEFRVVDGVTPFDVLLEETDPTFVDFEMDLYWITRAGRDPLDYFRRFPGRFKLVHVKDAGPPPELAMRDVGAGTIPWKTLFAQHRQAGIEHYFVEHDSPGADPFASVKASFAYLDRLTF